MSYKKKSVTAVVLAAGRGSRMKMKTNKMFLKINGIPVLYRTLYRLNQINLIDSIVLVCQSVERSQIRDLIRSYQSIPKIKAIVDGGTERSDSVRNALAKLSMSADGGFVMVHDGARPFITRDLVQRILESTGNETIAVPTLRVTETVRRKDENGQISVLNRDQLFVIQTPQAFRMGMVPICIFKKETEQMNLTDEASYFELAGKEISMVEGEKWNIKLTTPEDIQWAECLLEHHQQLKLEGLER